MQSIIEQDNDQGDAHRPTRTDQARKRKAIGLSAERPTAKSVLQMPPEENQGRGRLWLAVLLLVSILSVAFWLLFVTATQGPLLTTRSESGAVSGGLSAQRQSEANRASPLIEDDFTQPQIELSTEQAEGLWQMGFEDGFYRIRVDTPGNLVWSTLGVLDLGHYRLESDLALGGEAGGSGADSSSADETLGYGGLLVRFNNPENFYLFGVDDKGAFQILLQRQEVWQTLQPWLVTPALRTSGEVNRLAVEDDGQRLRFYANGELIYTVDAPLLPGGEVALAGGTRSQGSVQASFDWLAIYALDTSPAD